LGATRFFGYILLNVRAEKTVPLNKQEFLNIIDKYLNCLTNSEEEDVLFKYYSSFQPDEGEINFSN